MASDIHINVAGRAISGMINDLNEAPTFRRMLEGVVKIRTVAIDNLGAEPANWPRKLGEPAYVALLSAMGETLELHHVNLSEAGDAVALAWTGNGGLNLTVPTCQALEELTGVVGDPSKHSNPYKQSVAYAAHVAIAGLIDAHYELSIGQTSAKQLAADFLQQQEHEEAERLSAQRAAEAVQAHARRVQQEAHRMFQANQATAARELEEARQRKEEATRQREAANKAEEERARERAADVKAAEKFQQQLEQQRVTQEQQQHAKLEQLNEHKYDEPPVPDPVKKEENKEPPVPEPAQEEKPRETLQNIADMLLNYFEFDPDNLGNPTMYGFDQHFVPARARQLIFTAFENGTIDSKQPVKNAESALVLWWLLFVTVKDDDNLGATLCRDDERGRALREWLVGQRRVVQINGENPWDVFINTYNTHEEAAEKSAAGDEPWFSDARNVAASVWGKTWGLASGLFRRPASAAAASSGGGTRPTFQATLKNATPQWLKSTYSAIAASLTQTKKSPSRQTDIDALAWLILLTTANSALRT